MRILILGACALLVAGCGSTSHPKATATRDDTTAKAASSSRQGAARDPLVSVLRLPLVHSQILPGYLLVADRNNDRVLLLSPDKRIVWHVGGLPEPDDAFFTPGYQGVITNEEFNDTLAEVSLQSGRVVWSYGHAGTPGSAPGYLHAPDDAYRLANGVTTVADIQNCRVVELRPDRTVGRILGGSCVHDPPRGFSSPNGDTPLPDGGLLVTEIGGWIDRLDRAGHLVWSVRAPVSYPSDAQLLPNGHILVSGFTTPGHVVEMTRSGRIVWSFGAQSGENRLDRPSLAIRLPNGLVAINDDWRHRVIIVNPRTNRIVWQYGHTDVAGAAPGYLDKPDGMDFMPAIRSLHPPPATAARASSSASAAPRSKALTIARVGSLPAATSRLAAAVLGSGRIVAVGGLVGGGSSTQILAGPPDRLRRIGSLPRATHDAAAATVHGAVYVFGGGETTSVPTVVRVDPTTGRARTMHPLDEPLSDLGAAAVHGRTYLVGGYTGSRFASAILRLGQNDATRTAARLPTGLRYAGVAALGKSIYVAGGLTASGPSAAVYRFDTGSGRLALVATLPRPIAHAPLVAARGALWLIGGQSSRAVLRIDPRGRVTAAGRLPEPLANAAAVSLPDGRIVVLGGDGSDAVWELTPKR
jgi:outer membrane protein assembly factor BamB